MTSFLSGPVPAEPDRGLEVRRRVPALVATTGPHKEALLRGNGSLRLVLDPAGAPSRAWARIR
jgi:hypothetical protein